MPRLPAQYCPTKAHVPRVQEHRMSKTSHRQHPPLEVNIMFEPHRLQHDLLREAYSSLIPEARRRLSLGKRSAGVHTIQSPEG
jgi:hypothetical protein